MSCSVIVPTNRDWMASTRGYFRSYALVYERADIWEEAKRLYLHTQASCCIASFYHTRLPLSAFANASDARAGDKKALDSLLSCKELNPRFFVARRFLMLARWQLGALRRRAIAVLRGHAKL